MRNWPIATDGHTYDLPVLTHDAARPHCAREVPRLTENAPGVPYVTDRLLEDCRHLREQLALTQMGMSIGFTRGWKPSFDRD
ncbi:MAG: hypothetical protein AAAC47_17085 [Pararhizobium sp.]